MIKDKIKPKKPPKRKRTPEENRRYKLHQKIKMFFEYHGKQKTVIIPYNYDLQNEFIIELRDKFRYNIQYSIISPNEIEVKDFKIIN
ncbi:hypothetical protein KHA90_15755 [Flavobacterium psychroterrae]|uniref:Uncharacterized protein n=1 Tax=Flavobacterium psychroterrae TaxID=2133767 RepID=A0ABS5PDV3_9FLAO|nr:hypothetical protein [Flavobacterium psychroterrae]MBS7232474.1 hypothetical protein [Flavobacterium psychroterrae]